MFILSVHYFCEINYDKWQILKQINNIVFFDQNYYKLNERVALLFLF